MPFGRTGSGRNRGQDAVFALETAVCFLILGETPMGLDGLNAFFRPSRYQRLGSAPEVSLDVY